MKDKTLAGLVGIGRFSKGGKYHLLRDRDEPGCFHEDHERPIVAQAGDFLVRGWRCGTRKWQHYAVDAPVVISKSEYGERIWPTVKGLLQRYQIPAPDRCRYKEPNWSLQKYAAYLEAFDDDTIELHGMRGLGHGSFVGDGSRLRVTWTTPAAHIATKLLRAMGERPEDIPKLVGKLERNPRRRTRWS